MMKKAEDGSVLFELCYFINGVSLVAVFDFMISKGSGY
jgi:hypothetical protein